jgi:ATP-dependent DNA helicase DinG
MLIKFRQGAGRLIRNETDSGVISILDTRASPTGKYHKSVVAALPKCDVASSIEDIAKFLVRKKDESYFGKNDNIKCIN